MRFQFRRHCGQRDDARSRSRCGRCYRGCAGSVSGRRHADPEPDDGRDRRALSLENGRGRGHDASVKITVDVWSDIVCPWCYIGKRRFEAALAKFEHASDVELVWHSFQLDPSSPKDLAVSLPEMLAKKYGMTVAQAQQKHDELTALAAKDGLEYHFEKAKPGNTFDAHRLIHFAAAHEKGDAMKERLLRAYFTEGVRISDHDALAKLAGEIGLDEAAARDALAADAFADDVRKDLAIARESGISGVPAFVFADKYLVSGAQPADVFLRVLEKVWSDAQPAAAAEGATCDASGGGAC